MRHESKGTNSAPTLFNVNYELDRGIIRCKFRVIKDALFAALDGDFESFQLARRVTMERYLV